jgi:hypothetical protein
MTAKVSTGEEFLPTIVDISTDSTTVYADPVILRGCYVNTTLSAHGLPVKNGSTTVFTIPASTPAGTTIPFYDTVFGTSLVIDPDNSGTGSVTFIYKPADLP